MLSTKAIETGIKNKDKIDSKFSKTTRTSKKKRTKSHQPTLYMSGKLQKRQLLDAFVM